MLRHLSHLVLAMVFLALAGPAASDSTDFGDITISNAWSRASAGMARNGAAYLTLSSAGPADRLVAAMTPIAGRTELHTHLMEDGIMKMRQVPAIDISAGGAVELKPGGFHVMMFKLTQALNEGDHFPLKLTFEKAGSVTVMVMVGKAGAMDMDGNMKGMDHSNMDHGTMNMPASQ
ncbi:MAG: copper chaperone PCu(A)C [Rhodospirillaceae bacterium]|nr:copper chaperone PCu(A)C [Rhodospirillaceae bacterium]